MRDQYGDPPTERAPLIGLDVDVDGIARVCHEANRAFCLALGDGSQVAWSEAPEWQKSSARAGVVALLEQPDLSPAHSHDNWMRRKLEEGWTWGAVKDIERKKHPSLVGWWSLSVNERAKDVLFGSIVLALRGDPYGKAVRNF